MNILDTQIYETDGTEIILSYEVKKGFVVSYNAESENYKISVCLGKNESGFCKWHDLILSSSDMLELNKKLTGFFNALLLCEISQAYEKNQLEKSENAES